MERYPKVKHVAAREAIHTLLDSLEADKHYDNVSDTRQAKAYHYAMQALRKLALINLP